MKRSTSGLMLIPVLVGMYALVLAACGGGGQNNGAYSDYYNWVSLGSLGLGWNSAPAITFDPLDHTPIVAFEEMSPTWGARAMKWQTGTSWTDLGLCGGDGPSVTCDPSGNPIVASIEDGTGHVIVNKWSGGTTWSSLGTPSTGACNGYFRFPWILWDPFSGTPIVVFADDGTGGKVRVAKWSGGTNWTDLGFVSSGAGSFLSMAIPSDDKPIVAFVDGTSGSVVRVKKWSSGTSWTDMGSPSPIVACSTSIVIDPSDSKPIVAFTEIPNGLNKARVMKWSSGTSWSDLGYPAYDKSAAPSLGIDPSDNKPIVAFCDFWSDKPSFGGVHVMKWSSGTSWTGLGWPGPGTTSNGPCLAIDPTDNRPVVLCPDSFGPDQKVWVSKHP